MAIETEHDVVFVLGSDHLQMNNDTSFILNEHEATRANLFLILEKDKEAKIVNRPSSALDIASSGLEQTIG